MLPGVYAAKKKDGSIYYRSSITYRGKHVSLGSFADEAAAHQVYLEASGLLHSLNVKLEDYRKEGRLIPFSKWVSLVNFRDNGIYIKTPIYLRNRYFLYYLDEDTALTFDVDDLFYYSSHSVIRRNGRLFVSDFGMQVNLLSRYGVRNYAVAGKDYLFVNGNSTDFRYGNIRVVNKYHGVSMEMKDDKPHYVTKIHVNGYVVVGRYETEREAAIAYNKAAETLMHHGVKSNFPLNYVEEVDEQSYRQIFDSIPISHNIYKYTKNS